MMSVAEQHSKSKCHLIAMMCFVVAAGASIFFTLFAADDAPTMNSTATTANFLKLEDILNVPFESTVWNISTVRKRPNRPVVSKATPSSLQFTKYLDPLCA